MLLYYARSDRLDDEELLVRPLGRLRRLRQHHEVEELEVLLLPVLQLVLVAVGVADELRVVLLLDDLFG